MNQTEINIHNSFQFECQVVIPQEMYTEVSRILRIDLESLYKSNPAWKEASWMADKLNELIEEYHAPGNPRNKRRAIDREFKKMIDKFKKHCHQYKIQYTYQQV